jgi:hypothetical protein
MRTPFSSVQFNSVQFNSVQFNSIQFIQFNSSQFKAIQVNSFNSIQISSIQFNSIQLNSIHSFILLFLSITNIRNTEVPSNFLWLSYLSYLIFSYPICIYIYLTIHLSVYLRFCLSINFYYVSPSLLVVSYLSILPIKRENWISDIFWWMRSVIITQQPTTSSWHFLDGEWFRTWPLFLFEVADEILLECSALLDDGWSYLWFAGKTVFCCRRG